MVLTIRLSCRFLLHHRHGIQAASVISTSAAVGIIRRARAERGQPKVPDSLEELGKLMVENNMLKEIVGANYQGAVTPADGGPGHALIFAHKLMINELNQIKMLEIDGTMKVHYPTKKLVQVGKNSSSSHDSITPVFYIFQAVPTKPEATQMWIISFRKDNEVQIFNFTNKDSMVLYGCLRMHN